MGSYKGLAASVIASVMPGIAATSCGDPATAPTRGTATIALTSVLSPPDGSTQLYEFGVDVALNISATEDLVPRTAPMNLPFYVCLSEDGIHFTHLCQAGRGLGVDVRARVHGPPASSMIERTAYVIAFLIPAEDFGTPVSAFYRYGTGDIVPTSALASHVIPWTIQWRL